MAKSYGNKSIEGKQAGKPKTYTSKNNDSTSTPSGKPKTLSKSSIKPRSIWKEVEESSPWTKNMFPDRQKYSIKEQKAGLEWEKNFLGNKTPPFKNEPPKKSRKK